VFLKRLAYVEFTSDVSVTATTAATANQVVSAGAVTYEAAPIEIEFWTARYTAPAQQTWLLLRDGTTILGTFGNVQASDAEPGMTLKRSITPTAASHTYNVAAYLGGAGTGTFKAGTGGSAGDGTTYLRKLPYVDASHIGVWGMNYGGQLALHAMFEDPQDFKAGFAQSPISDWLRYRSTYAERYLGPPKTNWRF